MVETELVVNLGLPEGTNRQRVIEGGNEPGADLCNIRNYPRHTTVVANQRISSNVHLAAQWSFRQLFGGSNFRSKVVCGFNFPFNLFASSFKISACPIQLCFHLLHFFFCDDALSKQFLLLLQTIAQRLDICFPYGTLILEFSFQLPNCFGYLGRRVNLL